MIETTVVPTDDGDLRAGIWSTGDTPRPGLVLVDGSGDGTYDEWGQWPERFADCRAVVLGHDKPGCGGSPGDWLSQSFADRARESLAALRVLRAHPLTQGQPVGLYGVSQGGWVALLAATMAEPQCPVDFVVSLSGPGVSVAAQDRTRIERDLLAAALPPDEVAAGLAWLDQRTARLLGGEPVEAVLAAQAGYAGQAWYPLVTRYFDNPVALGFLARNLDFDPVPVLERVTCPVLALFGAADPLVPVPESVAAFATHLPPAARGPHGLAVFPGGDHGLFVADPDPTVPRTGQLAAGFLPMLAGFLRQQQPDYTWRTEFVSA